MKEAIRNIMIITIINIAINLCVSAVLISYSVNKILYNENTIETLADKIVESI